MTTKNLITTLTIIAIIAIGVTAVNVLIYIGCYSLLFIFKNPIGAAIVLFGLFVLGFIADTLYKKYKG
jgi:hypothetical protein